MIKKSSSSGFTLFELLITILIVGIVMGVVVGGVNDYLDFDMKQAANKLSSTIRYIYNKSATEGTFIRLVIDLDAQTYWVEATQDPVKISMTDEEERTRKKKGRKDTEKEKAKEEESAKGTEKEKGENQAATEGPKKLEPKKPSFGQVDSFLLKPTKLPDGIFFKDVYVEHRELPVDGGKESIYFFPNGYVESAIINIRDEKDEVVYSLRTNPINGRVDIENFHRNLEND